MPNTQASPSAENFEVLLHFCKLSLTSSDGKTLLNQVTGTLLACDKVVLLGRSGSGKSLLLQALADLLPLDDGKIFYKNQDINSISPALYRSQVALINQNSDMIDGTVMDNLCLPFSFAHHKHKPIPHAWYTQALQTLGKPSDFVQQNVADLSGGERQLVNVLRTLALNPAVLLLDEPTSALDPHTAHALITLITDWQEQCRTAFIWITHTPSEADILNARIWRMQTGELLL